MYRRTVAADTAPAVAAKHDLDHKVGSRDRRCGNSARSTRDVYPFIWFATYDGKSQPGLDEQVHVVRHDLTSHDPPSVLGPTLYPHDLEYPCESRDQGVEHSLAFDG